MKLSDNMAEQAHRIIINTHKLLMIVKSRMKAIMLCFSLHYHTCSKYTIK